MDSGDEGPPKASSGAMTDEMASPAPAGTGAARGLALSARVKDMLADYRDELMLLAPAAVYLVVIGALLLRLPGVALALIATVLIALFSRRLSADTMLSLYRAEPIAPSQGAALRAAISAMSQRAGLAHEPALAIVPSLAVGAFSVGGGPRLALLMTEGLLRRHSLREIVARAAHEIAHMRNGDLPILALADILTRVAQLLYYAGVALTGFEVLAWLAGERLAGWLPALGLLAAPMLNSRLQLALPRQREFHADRVAAALLGDARPVAAVVRRWEGDRGNPIDDFRLPVPQRRSPAPSPLRAHPDGADRARRLDALDGSLLGPPLAIVDEPLISLVGFGPIEMRPRNRWPGLWF